MNLFEDTLRQRLTRVIKKKLRKQPNYFGKDADVDMVVNDLIRSEASNLAFKMLLQCGIQGHEH